MRTAIALLAAGVACCASLGAAAAVKHKSVHHKTAVSRHSKHSAQTWRTRQTAPTPDRYKEIQTALAQKGYLHEEATGKWDQDSSDALRRFQHDQNLQANGKLDSLSLIALGLGPKHEASAAQQSDPRP